MTVIPFVLLAVAISGCGETTAAVSCPSWAGFPTVQEKYDAAELVIVASSTTRDGTAPIFGVDAHSYEVDVDQVIKGQLDGGSIRVSSTPDSCGGEAEYPEGDPLELATPVLIFATEQDGEWFTLTPFDGTHPFTQEAINGLT